MAEDLSTRDKLAALWRVGQYRPLFSVGIIVLSVFAAVLEGIGLSFLIPVIEIAQGNSRPGQLSGVGEAFRSVYEVLGLAFTLETVLLGVAVVMIARYVSSFIVDWLKAALQVDYVRHLQTDGFENALGAEVAYFDDHGSNEVLNAIVTQAEYAGGLIRDLVQLVEQTALSFIYLSVALVIAPVMTVVSALLLGSLLIVIRTVVESGYSVGDRVATANERIQESVQAGTQGIRDVKLFGLSEELFEDFQSAVDLFYRSRVTKSRNEAAMDNLYQVSTALVVFGIIYVSLTVADLSVAALGVFLFAMFRLAPRVSTLNDLSYRTASNLPHLVRTHEFIDDLSRAEEGGNGTRTPPAEVSELRFEDVSFAYNEDTVLESVSFEARRGEFVAFVGPSGAGKSTIISILARLYEPNEGRILANGTPLNNFDIRRWREQVSVVRQDPFIFNDTLRYNLTVGNREASGSEIDRVCEIAQVTEFLEDLPAGYETDLGDEGVKLSGGQRQRVAIARALLKDAEILVFDEATSDLDTTLEAKVQRAIEEMDHDYIVLTIAHRLSTVVAADLIHVMADGEIQDSGTHRELLDSSDLYSELYDAQSG